MTPLLDTFTEVIDRLAVRWPASAWFLTIWSTGMSVFFVLGEGRYW